MEQHTEPRSDLVARVRAWIADDPDADDRGELEALLAELPASEPELVARFAGTLAFGTAGLRGPLRAGPMGMNRVVVQRAAAGFGRYLLDCDPANAERGVAVGYDARRNSHRFALDTCEVLGGMGIRAHVLPGPLPTPVLAFATRHLHAAGGVMVTASHNPPQDNGYKVYLGSQIGGAGPECDGGQIVPPHDGRIAERIAAVGTIADLARSDALTTVVDVLDAYLTATCAVPFRAEARNVRVAYTPLHGVGGGTFMAAFERAGFPAPTPVVEQFEPDGTFPTVSFPNPEEPGAMDLVMALAASIDADVAIANDPDADRMAAAVPDPSAPGGWRRLTGNEIGWLLADHILANTAGSDRLVVTTVVSSGLLSRMASAAGVAYDEVLTGFKWIANSMVRHEHSHRFVFGYEEALGYLVGDVVRDKDGIVAALVMAEVAAIAKAEGTSLVAKLDAIAARFGRHLTDQRVVKMDPAAAGAAVRAMAADPPATIAGHAVTEASWRDDAGLLTLRLGDAIRLQLRPSGTEPKLKIYGEGVDVDPGPVLDALRDLVTG
jgi:phosphomannomutase